MTAKAPHVTLCDNIYPTQAPMPKLSKLVLSVVPPLLVNISPTLKLVLSLHAKVFRSFFHLLVLPLGIVAILQIIQAQVMPKYCNKKTCKINYLTPTAFVMYITIQTSEAYRFATRRLKMSKHQANQEPETQNDIMTEMSDTHDWFGGNAACANLPRVAIGPEDLAKNQLPLIQGTYQGSRIEDQTDLKTGEVKPRLLHEILLRKPSPLGNTILLWGCSAIDLHLPTIPKGTKISLEYLGMGKCKRGQLKKVQILWPEGTIISPNPYIVDGEIVGNEVNE
jgi:hypothetical protein